MATRDAPETSPKIAATRAADRVWVGSTVMPVNNVPITDTVTPPAVWRTRPPPAVEQIRRDTRGPEGVAIGRLSGRGPLGGQFDRHAIQADAEITRV